MGAGPRLRPRTPCLIADLVVSLFRRRVRLTAAYAAIAADLPSPRALRAQSASFVSTRIYDRNGHLLYEIVDPSGGRRILVPYEQISPHLINATVATEDERFWQHPGVDPIGILRAVIQNVQEGEIVSGASTIPQTLVDVVLLSPEERTEQTLRRKIREAVLASEISRRYTKREILEIYLNEVNFGNLAYGVEAAADTYFGKTVQRADPGRGGLAGRVAPGAGLLGSLHQSGGSQAPPGSGTGPDGRGRLHQPGRGREQPRPRS